MTGFFLGSNYHPSLMGCQWWRIRDLAEVERDFRAMREFGLSAVRFFLFWADVEPQRGSYDEDVLDHLDDVLEVARDTGLLCIPSLLTIWMNGRLREPTWFRDRSLFESPELHIAAEEYVRTVAARLRRFRDVLALIDIGDEVIHADPASLRLDTSSARAWQRRLADAVRDECPGVKVTQAHEHSAVFGTHGFRSEGAEALDVHAIHGFPTWAPVASESNLSFRGRCIAPFLVDSAHRFGPVLIDELGVYGASEERRALYLNSVLPALVGRGAVGAVFWCWRDIQAEDWPYDECPEERSMGLVTASFDHKPAAKVVAKIAAQLRRAWSDLVRGEPSVAVLCPAAPKAAVGGYLAGRISSNLAAFHASTLLRRAHIPYECTSEPQSKHTLLIFPCVTRCPLPLLRRLRSWVEVGGTLYWSVGDPLHGLGPPDLLGVEPIDFSRTVERHARLEWGTESLRIGWDAIDEPRAVLLREAGAEVPARFDDGTAALTVHRVGKGRVFVLNGPLELSLNVAGRLETDPTEWFYRRLAEEAGAPVPDLLAPPTVEVLPVTSGHAPMWMLINHGDAAASITFGGRRRSLAASDSVLVKAGPTKGADR